MIWVMQIEKDLFAGRNVLPKIENYLNLVEVVNFFFECSTNQDFCRGDFEELENKCRILSILENEEFDEDKLNECT